MIGTFDEYPKLLIKKVFLKQWVFQNLKLLLLILLNLFPLEHRKINFLDIVRLGSKADPKKEFEAIQKIDELLRNHKNERGLILTQSIPRRLAILKNLSSKNQKRIRICHSTNPDGKTQDEIIAERRKDKTGVLLSSSLWEGVDLKDDGYFFIFFFTLRSPRY